MTIHFFNYLDEAKPAAPNSKPKKSVEFKEINKTTEEVKKEEKLERPGKYS